MQELFNKALAGVLAQGKLSKHENGLVCRYYSSPGVYCGIGHLLPDDETRKRWDAAPGDSSVDYVSHKELALAGLTGYDLEFLVDLQKAHDLATSLDDFRSNMEALACKWGLDASTR